MSKIKFSGLLLAFLMLLSCKKQEIPLAQLIDQQLAFAVTQYKMMERELPDSLLPRSANPETGELVTSGSGWWCSGFFPGSLWYLYEYTGDSTLRQMSIKRTALIEKEKYNRGTHDLGFMLNCSYGNGLRIDSVPGYREVLITGAESLSSRFNPNTGCIRSWDNNKWMFPVIIDNMMNLEFLFNASRLSGDSIYRNIALTHALTTMHNHFRDDFSSYHVVDYDTITGLIRSRQTAQGFSDESAWSRGQSWGLYGFTMMYRETKDVHFLKQAENIAGFILNHPNLPEDLIPYWDFNAPGIPGEPRDVSSAAILCSALIELSGYTGPDKSRIYLSKAEKILRSLSSDKYRAVSGQNGCFILKHSVGSLPHKSEVDVPLTYADYYFIESLLRMKSVIEKQSS